ncbi:MAG: ribose 5-phosphate isomerase B [Pseudomonadota bacterium]
MKIAIASDHAGFEVKSELKKNLEGLGHEVIDDGPNSAARCDYFDFALKVAKRVADGSVEKGVLICGSGIGMCISANRLKHVRAAVLRVSDDAILSRKHNDANVACLGSRMNSIDEMKQFLKTFLETSFEGGRHEARVEKIDR